MRVKLRVRLFRRMSVGRTRYSPPPLVVGFYFINGGGKALALASARFYAQALGDSVQLVQAAEGNDHLAGIPCVDFDAYRSGKRIG